MAAGAGRDLGQLAVLGWPGHRLRQLARNDLGALAGSGPYLSSPAHFDDLVSRLRESGAVLDAGGVYWDVRPSHHLPTLEVRVTDAATTSGEALLFAALIRALVDTALDAIAAGEPDPDPEPEILRAAYWRAARDGLVGHAVDPRTARLLPARSHVAELVAHTWSAAVRNGDHSVIEREWLQLRERGCGADRQRAARRVRGRLTDVVDHLTLSTAPTQEIHRR